MISLNVFDPAVFIAFWLTFTRWTTILFQLPLFDNMTIPSIVKILSSLVITWAFFPLTRQVVIHEVNTIGLDNLWVLTAVHAVSGLVIGYLVKSLMSLFAATGSILTQQVGFASVTYFDPTQGMQVGPFEKMIQWTLLILILTSGALIPMFKGVVASFSSVNTLALAKLWQAPEFFTIIFKSIFSTAVLLAGPLLVANIMMNLVFGIVAKSIPQMNVLMVSFVVNIGIGLLLFLAISNEFFSVSFQTYIEKLGQWFQFFS